MDKFWRKKLLKEKLLKLLLSRSEMYILLQESLFIIYEVLRWSICEHFLTTGT